MIYLLVFSVLVVCILSLLVFFLGLNVLLNPFVEPHDTMIALALLVIVAPAFATGAYFLAYQVAALRPTPFAQPQRLPTLIQKPEAPEPSSNVIRKLPYQTTCR